MSTTIRGLLLCALVALLIAPAASARAQEGEVDIGYFYEQLEPYGRWIEHPRWGDVWSPDVDDDWRPYTLGYWAYSEDDGWYWVSDEPFGWAVFHYGRWVLDEDEGWLWIPGTEWAPAWVAWRADDDDDGFVGWAPLPPDSDWGTDGYLVYDESYYDGPQFAGIWIFVRPGYMTVPGMYRYAAPRPQNAIILRRAKHLRAHRKLERRVFNSGFDLRRYERLVGRPLPRMRLRSVASPRDFRDRTKGADIPVFRPSIVAPRDGKRPRPVFKFDGPKVQKMPTVRRTPDSPSDFGKGTEIRPDSKRDFGKSKGPDIQDGRGKKELPRDLTRERAKAPDAVLPKTVPRQLSPVEPGKEPRSKSLPQIQKGQPEQKAVPRNLPAQQQTTTPYSKGASPTFKAPSTGGTQTQPMVKTAPQVPTTKAVPQQRQQTAPQRVPDRPAKAPDKKDDKKALEVPK